MQLPEQTVNKITVIGDGAPLQVPVFSWWREVATTITYVCIRKGLDEDGRWRVCEFLEQGKSEPFEWNFDELSEAVREGRVIQVVQ